MIEKKLTSYMRKALTFSAIFFLIGLISCKKDGELKPGFDDGGLSINAVDTFSIVTSVVKEDSLRTDLSIYNLLGIYHDPIFGPTSSDIFTQITLTGVNVDFGATPTLDSAVLTMEYQEFYGDTSTSMSINVYELDAPLSKDDSYYSNSRTAYKPTAIGALTFKPKLNDSIYVVFDSTNIAPHIRIRLDNTFGQKLLDASASGSSNEMTNNADFTAFMNGLYITTADSVSNTSLNPEEGSILSLNMNSGLSTLTLYYNDTSKYNFTINSAGVTYSRFDHNYTGTDIEAHLTNSPTKDTTVTYVSTLSGIKTKIDIPYIKNLISDGNVAINKAELIVTLENGTEGNFDSPLESLSLVGIDEDGLIYFLPDFYEGLDYYGGDYDLTTKTYSFNIARYISSLTNGSGENYGMYLLANGGTITNKRSVIGSEKSSTAKIKLNITYSKI